MKFRSKGKNTDKVILKGGVNSNKQSRGVRTKANSEKDQEMALMTIILLTKALD